MNEDVLISAILIVKNEEQHLAACLDTIKDWVSEIIILDSGSTDDTLKIAERYQARVYQDSDWQGFGVQRQRAQRLANGTWCLWLDADERVTPELREEIESVIAKPADNTGYSIPRLNWYFGRYIRHCGWYPKPVLRLYPRVLTTYNDSYVHEKVIIPQDMAVKRLKNDLIHYPYKSLRHHVSKSSGYAHDWALAKYQQGKRTTLLAASMHSLLRFCRMYFFQRGLLDGSAGFLLSVISAYYTFLKYAELWVMQRSTPEGSTMTPTIMHVNLAKGFRGGERQTELLIRELAQHGLKQYLVCRDNSPLREHLKGVSNLEFIAANHQLMGHFAAHQKIDLIHAHEAKAVHWAWIENRLRGTPYILTRRVPQPVKQNLFNKLCYKQASQAVAISSPIANYLAGLQLTPVTTIPSALAHLPHHPEISKEIRQQYQDKFLIGHAGALVDKHKGQREIIKAAALLENKVPNIHFIMLGDGPDGEQFREESQHLRNMEWLGFKENPGDYFAALDLFVFPSRNEGLGSTLLDVMDFRVPIIASDVDGIPDIVKHEETGLLIPVNNADALAEAILRLFNNKPLREGLAITAKEKLDNFTPASMAKRYLALYRSLL